MDFFWSGDREEEVDFFHVLFEVVDQHQRENPFLYGADDVKRMNYSSYQRVFNPVNSDKLGIDVPLSLVLRLEKHWLDGLVVD